jgi:hypothetical protein
MTIALIKSDSIGVGSGIGSGVLLLAILSFQIPVSIIIKGVATARTSPPRKITFHTPPMDFFSFGLFGLFSFCFSFSSHYPLFLLF